MSAYPLVKEAADFCWSRKSGLMDRFKAFMERHAHVFIGAPGIPEGGEQDLEMFELFQDYLKVSAPLRVPATPLHHSYTAVCSPITSHLSPLTSHLLSLTSYLLPLVTG